MMFLKSGRIEEAPFKLFHRAEDVPKKAFSRRSVFLQKDYLRSLEAAAPAGMEFRYLYLPLSGQNGTLYYFQAINLSSKEIGQIINFQPYSNIIKSISDLVQSFLFGTGKDRPNYLLISGNMCLSGPYGIGYDPQDEKTAAAHLFQAIEYCSKDLHKKGKVVATIVKDYPEGRTAFSAGMRQHRYNRLTMDPVMKMEIRPEWKTMSDYVGAITSKYRQRYQQARKKMGDCTVRVLTIEEAEKLQPKINELYTAVQEKSPVRIVQPHAGYLLSILKNMGDKAVMYGIFHEEKLIGFMTGISDGDHYEAHHIGMDYDYIRSQSLYLNILYCYIEMAIRSGARELSFGRTALEMKTTVGAIPDMHEAWLKLSNRMLNSLACHLIPEKTGNDWIPRNPFRD
jgi:hypothetical protein